MRKLVKKRKGYAGGGTVDTTGDQLADTWNATRNKTPEAQERYIAASRAIRSGWQNESGIPSSKQDITPETRANYPGFRKGGKVKKVIRKR